MDAPSSGWEPIDGPARAPATSAKAKSTKKHRSHHHHQSDPDVSNVAAPGFPVTGSTQPYLPGQYNASPMIPQGPGQMNYGGPQMAGPNQFQNYYPGAAPQFGMQNGPGNTFSMGTFPGAFQGAPAYFADPLANVAVAYGQSLAGQGKEIVNQNLEKWFSVSTLKFYFAVDTKYVARKLMVLFLPFVIRDWSIRFPPSQCVAPREEPNAPDLYVPSMAFVTYILASGVLLGLSNKFTPEHLGAQASENLAWLIVEILAVLITFYITNISSNLRFLHLLAFTGYKYAGMVLCVVATMFMGRWGYRMAMLYASLSIVWFFLRSLKVYILPEVTQADNGDSGGYKRRLWALLFITALQPVMMWLITRHIPSYSDLPVLNTTT
ncbi:hypothetical protein RvY_08632 [Ramazzottius varieornatus]|uniref:Protein YIF1 n=1 Tax=Ramazzottius varieornatus TaxID=947166 RepID=A0A1D1VB71_RAMVA|nr:hypothetical protein RvY_08632 [Ramazzottius varieornatus]